MIVRPCSNHVGVLVSNLLVVQWPIKWPEARLSVLRNRRGVPRRAVLEIRASYPSEMSSWSFRNIYLFVFMPNNAIRFRNETGNACYSLVV